MLFRIRNAYRKVFNVKPRQPLQGRSFRPTDRLEERIAQLERTQRAIIGTGE